MIGGDGLPAVVGFGVDLLEDTADFIRVGVRRAGDDEDMAELPAVILPVTLLSFPAILALCRRIDAVTSLYKHRLRELDRQPGARYP